MKSNGERVVVFVLGILLIVTALVRCVQYEPSILLLPIRGSGVEIVSMIASYNDGRRACVGRFKSKTIDVGDNITLSNADTSGNTNDVFVVMVRAFLTTTIITQLLTYIHYTVVRQTESCLVGKVIWRYW
jgi:hypothetical protein